MAHATQTRTAGVTLTDRIAAFVAASRDAAAKRRVYRTTLRELDGLNTRELNDLGISRGDIRNIAFEAAYGH